MSSRGIYVLLLGFFLGLALVKFGNPVVLESRLDVPQTLEEYLAWPWPLRWATTAFLPLAIAGFFRTRPGTVLSQAGPWTRWLLILPALWLGWQFLAAQGSVDPTLTALVLPHFTAAVASFYLGYLLLREASVSRWLWPGLLLALAFCLVRSLNQYAFEFPQSLAQYREGDRTGWTNATPEDLAALKRMQLVVTTNGVNIANPIIVRKLEKRRVFGTLVYPNALAAGLLLLLPAALVLAWTRTGGLRPWLRHLVVGLTGGLGGLSFFLTGSKAGWLVALGVAGVALLRSVRSVWTRALAMGAVVVIGLGVFFVRHAGYFQQGATSASARLDYWRAAAVTAGRNPWMGTGPGTFQRPYAEMKSPEQEMARLVHNDYLEQASDSGWPGAVLYTGWVVALVWTLGRRLTAQRRVDPLIWAVWLGLLGWFLQSVAEFSLYIPALAWPAFLLAGQQLAETERVDPPGIGDAVGPRT